MYVSSPHAGYFKLFERYRGATLFVLGQDFINEHPQLVRFLPANPPGRNMRMIQREDEMFSYFSDIRLLNLDNLHELSGFTSIVMPDEDIARLFAEKYLGGRNVAFDGSWRLRWDWGSTKAERHIESDVTVSLAETDRMLMRQAYIEANRSPDWWRQIGALLVRGGKPLLVAFNRHLPSEQSAYLEGDPRSSFEPGERIDVSVAGHAERRVIAEAARRGLAMEGCDLYVTTFPCPPCAYELADTGICRLYYAEGYSLIAGADSLRAKNIELIRVDMTAPSPSSG